MLIKYYTGEVKEFQNIFNEPEYKLVVAAYKDNKNEVQKILKEYPSVDVNAIVFHSKTRANGTPLILTGKKDIAKLLIEHNADLNVVMEMNNNYFTALDSAYKELEKNNSVNKNDIYSLIEFLKGHGAKRYEELCEHA